MSVKKKLLIYSLSKYLKSINKFLSQDINLLATKNLQQTLADKKPNVLLFDWDKIKYVLAYISENKFQHTRFICIDNDLSAEKRLALLNKNIDFLTLEKFTNISINAFILWTNPEKYKILLVKSDLDHSFLNVAIFKKASISIKYYHPEDSILEKINTFRIDLILVDLSLDEPSAKKLVKQIRQNPKSQSLPIVFLTKDSSLDTRMDILNLGVDDVLTKPINSELLVSALLNRIERNSFQQLEVKQKPKKLNVKHLVEDKEHNELEAFVSRNKKNKSATVLIVTDHKQKYIT